MDPDPSCRLRVGFFGGLTRKTFFGFKFCFLAPAVGSANSTP